MDLYLWKKFRILYLDHTENFYVLVICKVSLYRSMRHMSLFLMIFLAVSIMPVYAQNTSDGDLDDKIWSEILACEEKIMANSEMTDAEKTVQKRQCSSEIRKQYQETPLTAKAQNEMKIKLQNLQRCDDWYASYKFLDEATFRLQKNAQMVTSCIVLYNDSLWKYDGNDRQQILSEKLDEIMSNTPVKTNISNTSISENQNQLNRIQTLEKRIAELEDNLKNKDMIIQEQMNVIVSLANSLKNIIFNGIQSFYPYA